MEAVCSGLCCPEVHLVCLVCRDHRVKKEPPAHREFQ